MQFEAITASEAFDTAIDKPLAYGSKAFDSLMDKLHILLDMRKAAEKEEQELKVREAEAAAQVKSE